MTALRQELRLFLLAVQFLTRIPVPGWVGFSPAWLIACVRYFPVVGAGVGAGGAAVLVGAQVFWPPWVAASLGLAATVWLTAAFHEDGLADTFDALLGAAPREKALAIMKDSRIGTYGAAALVLTLGLRAALLSEALHEGAGFAAAAMVGSHSLGRAAAVLLMATLAYAGDADRSKAKPLARAVRRGDAGFAALWCLVLLVLPIEPLRWLSAAVAVAVVIWIMRGWLRRRLAGYTGDTLGAVEQLAEITVLLALVARW